MKKIILLIIILGTSFWACTNSEPKIDRTLKPVKQIPEVTYEFLGTAELNSQQEFVFQSRALAEDGRGGAMILRFAEEQLKDYMMNAYDAYTHIRNVDESFWVNIGGTYHSDVLQGDSLTIFNVNFVALGENPEPQLPIQEELSHKQETLALEQTKFEWFSCKSRLRFLNCGIANDGEKHYLDALKKEGGFVYAYCLHNANQPKEEQLEAYEMGEKLIAAKVWKKGKKIGYYTDKNEDLLLLKSKVRHSALASLNIVGLTREEVGQQTGMVGKNRERYTFYSNDTDFLVCYFTGKMKVEWFVYYPNYYQNEEEIWHEGMLNWKN